MSMGKYTWMSEGITFIVAFLYSLFVPKTYTRDNYTEQASSKM